MGHCTFARSLLWTEQADDDREARNLVKPSYRRFLLNIPETSIHSIDDQLDGETLTLFVTHLMTKHWAFINKFEICMMITFCDLITRIAIISHDMFIKMITNSLTCVSNLMTMSTDLFITLFTNAEQSVHRFDDLVSYTGEQIDYSWCNFGHQTVQPMC